jgi:hypothetical protein
MNNPFRKVQRIADWLDDLQATRDNRRLNERYSLLVSEAEKKKDVSERDCLVQEWELESDFVLHPVYQRRGERLTAKLQPSQ